MLSVPLYSKIAIKIFIHCFQMHNQSSFTIIYANYYMRTLIHHSIFLLVLFTEIETNDNAQRKCQNDGKLDKSQNMCTCKPAYIGNQCQMKAAILTDRLTDISINTSFSFAYYEPQDTTFYQLDIQFRIPPNSSQGVRKIQFFIQQQKFDNTFLKEPVGESDSMTFQLSHENQSISFHFNRILQLQQKMNGEKTKIIVGIRLMPDSQVTEQILQVACFQQQIFSLNLIKDLAIIFIAFTIITVCSSAIFTLRRKFLQRRQARRKKRMFDKLVTQMMPLKKFQKYLKQNQIQSFEENCSICLSEFQPKNKIRQTPCKHIFHQECIDSWCKNQMNCPICRYSFEQKAQINQNEIQNQPMQQEFQNYQNNEPQIRENQIEMEQIENLDENFRQENQDNIRERML